RAAEVRLRLLARGGLAVGLHGRQPRDARAARPRAHLPPLRVPERHARAPERVEPARAGLSLAADLRGGGAERHSAVARGAGDLLAAPEGLLLADAREVRYRRPPPARSFLSPRGFYFRYWCTAWSGR